MKSKYKKRGRLRLSVCGGYYAWCGGRWAWCERYPSIYGGHPAPAGRALPNPL